MKTFKKYFVINSFRHFRLRLNRSVILAGCLILPVWSQYADGQTGAPTTFDLYVALNGNNLNPGTQAAPYRTIQWAIDHAPQNGATIKIGAGVYEERPVIVGKNIKLVGETAQPLLVVIDGSRTGTTLTVTNCRSEFYGIAIINGRALDTKGGGAHLTNANAYFYGVVFSANWEVLATGSAIASTGNSTLQIHNSLIYNNRSTYSIVDIQTGAAVMNNVTMAGNRAGIMVNACNGASVDIRNSIVYNSPYQPSYNYFEFANDGSCLFTVNYTNCNNKKDGTIQFGTGIQYDTDPQFVGAAENQYQLLSASPCIDAGDPAAQYNDRNFPPSQGAARCDLGAYGGNAANISYQTGDGSTPPVVPGEPVPDRPEITTGANSSQNYVYTVVPQTGSGTIPKNPEERSPDAYLESVQYYDVFFRPTQTVSIAASPAKNDIVAEERYDVYGRKTRQYLPYETGNSGLGAERFYASPPQGIPADTYPYSETIYEYSSFNRVREQYGPGQAWRNGGKGQRITYRANLADEVRLWTATETQISSSGYYAAGKLYVTETTDEDGRKMTEYADTQGRTVRQQQQLAAGNAVTDYVYDPYGRKAYVLPPAVDKSAGRTIPVDGSEFAGFIYAYRYDYRDRVVKKHVPGAGWTYTVYNYIEQIAFTQDADQRTRNEWTYFIYDAEIGRMVITGLYTGASAAILSGYGDHRLPGEDYFHTTYPASGMKPLTVYYYDNYDFPGNPFDDASESDRPQGLLTCSKTKVVGSDPEVWLYSVTYYDHKGRAKLVKSQQLTADDGKAVDQTRFYYDFTGKITRTERSIAMP
ncbi:MAG: DUF1565 domain-containing protein [Bacteroidales bacterium]|jgi:hypothetical protein|nr:DUF1565 domain-containing protein [Bacteroidales bacterium]